MKRDEKITEEFHSPQQTLNVSCLFWWFFYFKSWVKDNTCLFRERQNLTKKKKEYIKIYLWKKADFTENLLQSVYWTVNKNYITITQICLCLIPESLKSSFAFKNS